MFKILPKEQKKPNISTIIIFSRKEAFHFWEIFGKFLGDFWETRLLINY